MTWPEHMKMWPWPDPWPDPTNQCIQELEARNAELEGKLAEAEAKLEEGRGVLKTLWVYLQYAERYYDLDAQLLRSHKHTDEWRGVMEARDTAGLDMDAALAEVLKIDPAQLQALAKAHTQDGQQGGE